jgi:hypothetical protein
LVAAFFILPCRTGVTFFFDFGTANTFEGTTFTLLVGGGSPLVFFFGAFVSSFSALETPLGLLLFKFVQVEAVGLADVVHWSSAIVSRGKGTSSVAVVHAT